MTAVFAPPRWRVDLPILPSAKDREPLGHLNMACGALAVSSLGGEPAAERGWVAVWAGDAPSALAFSYAIGALGIKEGLALMAEVEGVEALTAEGDKGGVFDVRMTSGFERWYREPTGQVKLR